MKEIIAKLTWVDYLTVFAMLRGMYVGYKSGFFPELLRIVAYVATAVSAFNFYQPLAEQITLKTFLNEQVSSVAAFTIVALVVFLLARLVILLLLKLLKIGEGGVINRILGVGLGVCRWTMILSMVFLLINSFPSPSLREDVEKHSFVGPYVKKIAPTLFEFLSTLSPQLAVKDTHL